MAKRLLVVIDPQNDFTHPEGNYATRHPGTRQIEATKAKINQLLRFFGRHQSVLVRSNYKHGQFGPGLSMCIPNTFGHEIDADIQVDATWTILTKTEHSCFSSAAFLKFLTEERIDTLVLSGFLAEYCVRQTATDALQLGYHVFVVADGIATGDDVQYRKQQVLAALKDSGAAIVDSGHFLRHE